MLGIIQNTLELGMIYALITGGVHLSMRVIRFNDLAVDGSFGLGGALMAICVVNLGLHPLVGMVLAMVCGSLTGIITAVLHTHGGISRLMSGLIVTTGLYSICLAIAGPLCVIRSATLFDLCRVIGGNFAPLMVLVMIGTVIIALLAWFLQTEVGLLMRATGENLPVVAALGKSPHFFIMLSLATAHALTGLAGALFVQLVGYFSIAGQIGTLAIGMASLMLGSAIAAQSWYAIIIGPVVYQLIIAITIELGVNPSWNRLIAALLLIGVFLFQHHARRRSGHAAV